MPRSKDYSIYQELDLSIDQIKRQLPRVAQAANSRLAKLEKNHARDQWEYGRVKEFFASQGREKNRFLKGVKRSDASIRQEWDIMVAFLNAPETTVSGYKIAEFQRRFDKSKKKINAVVTEDNFKDLYHFLSSNLYRKNLRKELASNQIIDDFVEKIDDPNLDYKDIKKDYQLYLDGYITKEELFAKKRTKLK
jgi:regulator of replication initiation timing